MKQAKAIVIPYGLALVLAGIVLLLNPEKTCGDWIILICAILFGIALVNAAMGKDDYKDADSYLDPNLQFVSPPWPSSSTEEEWNEYERKCAKAAEHNYRLTGKETWMREICTLCVGPWGDIAKAALSPEMRAKVERRIHG